MQNGKFGKMKELKNIYCGKKVFVTGHTGFKGSWLIQILNDFGAIIRGYALNQEKEPSLYSQINGDFLCDSVINDIRNKNELIKAVLDFEPDYVFHLAAQPIVRLSYEIPSETFEVNVIGTANLLDAIRLLNKKCNIVLITTDKVYHNNEWEYPYRESDRLGGYDPYSASKACSELVIESYKNSFFNYSDYINHQKSIAVGRAGNVIGGGDWSRDRLIPDIVTALFNKEQIEIRSPDSIRPWQHVIEPLIGYLELGAKLNIDPNKFSRAYNFGPNTNDEMSVLEVVKKSIIFWGCGSFIYDKNPFNPHEAGILRLDISKALRDLNWKPKFDSKNAIERTITWYKDFYNGKSATELIKSDIQYYKKILND